MFKEEEEEVTREPRLSYRDDHKNNNRCDDERKGPKELNTVTCFRSSIVYILLVLCDECSQVQLNQQTKTTRNYSGFIQAFSDE